MKLETASQQFSELGHPTRLEVFKFLVSCGSGGCPVSTIQEHLDIPPSTLSHHLKRLAIVNLIGQEKNGRVIQCFAEYQTLEDLFNFMKQECCSRN